VRRQRCKHVNYVSKSHLGDQVPSYVCVAVTGGNPGYRKSKHATFIIFVSFAFQRCSSDAGDGPGVGWGGAQEAEFLFAPYSTFEVVAVEWSSRPDDDHPHQITIRCERGRP